MAKTEMTQTQDGTDRRLAQSATARRLLTGVAILTLAACAAPAGVSETQESLERAGVPSVSGSMLDLADQLAAEGKYAAALPLYRRAQDVNGSERAAMGLGNAFLKTGRNTEALEVFEKAADEYSRSAAPMEGVGRAWMAVGRPGTALPAFDAALARNPGSASAMNGKGVALASLGRTREALSIFEQGLRRAPDDLALKNNYGLALTLADQSDLGLPLLEEVVLDERARAKERQSLAMAYGVAGQTEDARQMAAIDLDLIEVDRQIASYRTLSALPVDRRASAAMSSLGGEKMDIDKPANRGFLEPIEAHATVRRLLVEPEVVAEVVPAPEPMPEPVSEPAPEPEPVAEDMDIPPLDDHVGYAVQIAAYRTADELNPGWEALKAKYEDLIGDLEPRRSEVDFGDRNSDPRGFFYRLNAGPLNSYSAARTICEAITAQGGDCWVRPPLPAEGRVPTADSLQEDGALPRDVTIAETPDAEPMLEAQAAPAEQTAPQPETAVTQAAEEDDGDVWVAIDPVPTGDPAAPDGPPSEAGLGPNGMPPAPPVEESVADEMGSETEERPVSVSEAEVY